MHIHFFFMIICHSERSEDVLLNEVKNLGSIMLCVVEILPPFGRLDDNMIGNFYYDTSSFFYSVIQSEAKNLGSIMLCVTEILRYALDDKM